jgi:outer membrane immunogenic protein
MKRLLTTAAILASLSVPALGADLTPTPTAFKAVPAAVFSWTGFYVGGNLGYGWAASGGVPIDPATPAANNFFNMLGTPGSLDQSSKGLVGGGQAGFNLQYGTWVVGIEALVDATNMQSSAAQNAAGAGMAAMLSSGTRIDWDDAVLLRLGFTPAPNFLIAAIGGVAFGNISDNAAVVCVIKCTLNGFSNGPSNIHAGWTLGAEIDYALTSNIIAGVRYRYVDLGTQSFLVTAGGAPASATFNASDSARWNEIVGTINFKF